MPKLLLLLLLIISVPLRAQDVIHHCIGSDGHPVFTDQPCAALNATPTFSVSTPATGSSITGALRESPPVLCAATREALRQSVTEAFAARDPNRLAALMLWSGYGKQSAAAQIQGFGQLMKRPLIGIGSTNGDTLASSGSNAAVPPYEDDDLVVRTAENDGSGAAHETRFAITRRSGCLWLKP